MKSTICKQCGAQSHLGIPFYYGLCNSCLIDKELGIKTTTRNKQ